ncbi:hypothetical protein ACOQFV_24510 [Nocardiopsis changdeensis]|uniref:Uncharacterized protein n=1 Tax=Nocardiopsis changdeensis TaxID=2831969 RepID=A0A975KSR9_9ACTN|nr:MULTISPECIES: hypothetical protein [Nocardiopsis]QUX26446.1 hypothetical protein KGD84_32630 [Nocardiopsis changdeensis]QYX40718.1 hypothetical protein K1J57_32480 [Nocardiopsis sp. MT53]
MTEHTQDDREALRRWARDAGHDDAQAEAIATDSAAHRAALAAWLTERGLDPAQAADPATPPDPAILAEWGPTHGIQPNTAEVLASTRETFPPRRTVGLRVVKGARDAQAVAAEEFAPGERVGRETYAKRTGMAATTVKRSVAAHANQAPETDGRNRFDAQELAAFLADLRYPGPGLYSLAELEAWRVTQVAASHVAAVDPGQFGEGERITVKAFCDRTGRDRSTVSKAINNPRWQGEDAKPKAPVRGADGLFDAREIAAFLNGLPRRVGKPPKSRG